VIKSADHRDAVSFYQSHGQGADNVIVPQREEAIVLEDVPKGTKCDNHGSTKDAEHPKRSLWVEWFHKERKHCPPGSVAWTTEQAFFVIAGELILETKSFWAEPYLTLTAAGVIELARLGLLPPEAIRDKFKADSITKFLACGQASWFIIQAIARVTQNCH
jgi:hypothetical protein